MAGLNMDFDPNAVEPDTGGSGGLHPEGDFKFEIQESDVKPTKSGKGLMLEFTLVGIGDDNKGRKVWERLNIQHESAQAQAIGQGQLSALCRAADYVGTLQDSEQLHYRPLWARIKHEVQTDKDKKPLLHPDGAPKMRAVVARYLFEDGEAAPAPSTPASKPPARPASPPPPPPPAAAAGGTRPWSRPR